MSFIKEYIGIILFLSPIVILPVTWGLIYYAKIKDIDKATRKGDISFVEEKYDRALKYYLRRYKFCLRLNGKSNPKSVKLSIQIAKTYMRLSKPEEAEGYALNSLDYYENLLGEDYDERLKFLFFLEDIYKSIGERSNAGLAICYLRMALVYDDMHEYGDAWVKYTTAIRLLENAEGDNKHDIADVYYYLAQSSFAQEKYDEALTQFGKALEIYSNEDPPHSDAAVCHHYIGYIYNSKEMYAEALENLLESLYMVYCESGKEHPKYKQLHDAARSVFISSGNTEEGFESYIKDFISNKKDTK